MSSKKPKLLYADFAIPHVLQDNDYPAGGIAVEWLSWLEGFCQTGHTVAVLTWKGAGKFIGRELDFELVESYSLNKGLPFFRFFYYWFPKIFLAIHRYDPDVVIQEGCSVLTFLCASAARLLNKRFVYRVASDKDVDKRTRQVLTRRDNLMYQAALTLTDVFVCQNSYQLEQVSGRFPDKKRAVVYNPFVMHSEAETIHSHSRSYVAWVGNFRHEKNIAALIPIAESLPEVNFRIAGKPSAVIDTKSKEALARLDTLKNVSRTGYLKRSEVIPFLSRATALLNTSYLEGFSNTFLEAWSAGTPVITTRNVNPDAIITKHQLGFVAETFADLPAVIRSVTESPPEETARRRYRAYVEHVHNPKRLALQLAEIITSPNRKTATGYRPSAD